MVGQVSSFGGRSRTECRRWPGGGRMNLPPSRVRITSPYDPNSRSAVRRGSAWDGYKVHFTESCDAQESGRPHLITNVVTTDATVGDPLVIDEIHDRLHAKHLLPGEHLMDAGFISAELLLTAPSRRGVRVIGPVRPHTRHTVQATGYGKTSFSIDWDARQATCPNGAHSRHWTEGLDNNQRPASASASPPRPARLARARRTRYAGLRKTALAHVLTATAINLIHIDAWWTGQPLAPTRTSHLAALGLAAKQLGNGVPR